MRILSGIDIVEVSRIERSLSRHGDAFINKCFTEGETAYCDPLPQGRRTESFSARFAAKEAFGKAIGTGIMSEGIALTDVEIVREENGSPRLVLHGKALEAAEQIGVISMSVSLSHDGAYAVASCTLLTED